MSENLFLYGTLRFEPLLEEVAGWLPERVPATLEGYRVAPGGSGLYPVLVQEPGAVARGLLIRDADPVLVDRLRHYEEIWDYALTPCQVTVDEGDGKEGGVGLPARVFALPHPGAVMPGTWDLSHWIAARGRPDTIAAAEIMRLWGRFSTDDMKFRLGQIEARAHARARAEREPGAHAVGQGPTQPRVALRSVHDDHAGYFFTRTYDLSFATFGGAMSDPVRREVFLAPDAAIVLPYDPVRDRVLLVEQFRMGPYARGEALPWMLEPVAGRVDPGEEPATCARREAREEAGLDLGELIHISSCYPTPGCCTEFFHLYLGLCDLPDGPRGTFGVAAEAEDIRTHVLPFEAAMELVTSGEARNAPLILSLVWLSGKRSSLRGAA